MNPLLHAIFVTSAFGMGGILPESMSLAHFAIIFGVVCGLTYIAIVALGLKSTKEGQFRNGDKSADTGDETSRLAWYRRGWLK